MSSPNPALASLANMANVALKLTNQPEEKVFIFTPEEVIDYAKENGFDFNREGPQLRLQLNFEAGLRLLRGKHHLHFRALSFLEHEGVKIQIVVFHKLLPENKKK